MILGGDRMCSIARSAKGTPIIVSATPQLGKERKQLLAPDCHDRPHAVGHLWADPSKQVARGEGIRAPLSRGGRRQ